MAEKEHDDDIRSAVKSGYAVPPPADAFVESLQARLLRKLPSAVGADQTMHEAAERKSSPPARTTPTGNRQHRLRWAVTAACIVAGLLAAPFVLSRIGDQDTDTVATAPKSGEEVKAASKPAQMPGQMPAQVEAVSSPAQMPNQMPIMTPVSKPVQASSANATPLSVFVGRSSAVLRGEMMELTDTYLRCKVTRVIYGDIAGSAVDVEGLPAPGIARMTFRSKYHREPNGAELRERFEQMHHFEVGRDVILFVDQCQESGTGIVARWVHRLIDSAARPLDGIEQEIVETIQIGAHLAPPATDEDLREYLLGTERIVRAELTKIGEASTEWQVTEIISDTPPLRSATHEETAEAAGNRTSTRITVSLDAWRLRAKAILDYRTARQGQQPPTQQEIETQFARLVREELTPGQEAILFIPNKDPKSRIAYKYTGIFRGDTDNPQRNEQFERRVRQQIEDITSIQGVRR